VALGSDHGVTENAGADAYLRRRNPTMKIGVALVVSLLLTLVIDPVTPLLFLASTCLAGWLLGGVAPWTYARTLAPLAVMASGFVWTNALFATTSDGGRVLWTMGPVRATEAGLLFGLGIGLRGLAIGGVSLTMVLTTDPTDLVVSLIRHARLPFRIGYSLLAGLRFLPFFAQEYENVRLARRVRGQGQSGSWIVQVRRNSGYVVPLLSLAVRRAARIAVAMDSRGFSTARERTYYRQVPLGWRDGWFALAACIAAGLLMAASHSAGWLRLWDGRFSA